MIETFSIVPAHVRAGWLVVVLGFAVIGILAACVALGVSLRSAQHAQFEVSPAGLRLRGDLWGRMVPGASLRLAEARVVDLRSDRDLAPSSRTAGTAMPGYRSGWFRLRNGERALLYVTDPSRVAYVPTRAGYVLLISVPDPAAFLGSLRRLVRTAASPSLPPGV